MRLGEIIKKYRQDHSLTLREFAQRCGTSHSYIAMLEDGKNSKTGEPMIPTLTTLKKISTALNMALNDLMLEAEDMPVKLETPPISINKIYNRIVAKNIKHHRELNNLTQKQLADLLGVDEKTITVLESGNENLSQEMLYRICDALDLIPRNIIPGDDEDLNEDTKYLLSQRERERLLFTRLQSFDEARPIARKKLPMLGNIACGEPIFATEEHDTYIDVDSDIAADFCLTAKGDSMVNARIFDGDILFVKKQDTVDDGEIAVVLIEDEATVKRVYYDKENNILTLMPENPTHKPMRYEGEKLNQIRILGKIVFGQYNLEHE